MASLGVCLSVELVYLFAFVYFLRFISTSLGFPLQFSLWICLPVFLVFIVCFPFYDCLVSVLSLFFRGPPFFFHSHCLRFFFVLVQYFSSLLLLVFSFRSF